MSIRKVTIDAAKLERHDRVRFNGYDHIVTSVDRAFDPDLLGKGQGAQYTVVGATRSLKANSLNSLHYFVIPAGGTVVLLLDHQEVSVGGQRREVEEITSR